MGVDSGLPDFRSENGFYKHYPYFEKVGMRFEEAACPAFFRRDPKKFWYFYGHRFLSYRATVPNEGFTIMLNWLKSFLKPKDGNNYFVFTSNVDNQF